MKITVYTINDCQFSVQEKEYLKSLNLQFEEKNLETNRDFLTEMLSVSNNFAGTPVTKIEKDDGQIVVLKGFTKEEFDKALGNAPAANPEGASAPVAPPVNAPTATPTTVNINNFGAPMAPPPTTETVAQPATPEPVPAMSTVPPADSAAINDTLSKLSSAMGTMPAVSEPAPIQTPPVEATSAPTAPVMTEPVVETPPPAPQSAPTTINNPALNSILNNLEQKAGDNAPPTTNPAVTQQPAAPGTPPTSLS